MYRGNKKVQVQTSFLLSRTHAQSIHKVQNTMVDIGLGTVEISTKVWWIKIDDTGKYSDFVEIFFA